MITRYTVSGMLALLAVFALASNRAAGQEDGAETTPEERFEALTQEYQETVNRYCVGILALETEAEKRAFHEKNRPRPDRFAPRFLKLAEAHPGADVALDALLWIVANWAHDAPGKRAIEILMKHHVEHEKMRELDCRSLTYGSRDLAERFLRALVARSPYREVRGRACFALAEKILWEARVLPADGAAEEPDSTPAAASPPPDPEARRREAERLYLRVAAEFGNFEHADGTLGAFAQKALHEMRELAVGKPAPEIEGKDLDGKAFKLSDYRGKVVLLVFCGHWCGACRSLYPYERALVKRMADKPFALLWVNSDPNDEKLRAIVKKEEITWRFFCDGGTWGPISRKWYPRGWPTVYVIDEKGVIRHKDIRGKKLDEALDRLVANRVE
jgi:peroxiredoxin